MKELKKVLKEVEKFINFNYIHINVVKKEIKKLEKERNDLVKSRTDRVYDNVEIDRIIKIINIKIDTLKELIGGEKYE